MYSAAIALIQLSCSSSHTLDQTANADGSSEGSTAGVEGAVEPDYHGMLAINGVLELLLVVGVVVLTSGP